MPLALAAAATLAACSGTKSEDDQGSATTGAADPALPAALSGEEGFALAADCSAKLKSVSNLYSTLAAQSSGTDAEDLAKRASQRDTAATAFAQIAERAAGTIGKTPEQAAQAIRDADAAVHAEFEKRPFEDFATWVTNEVDTKCREALSGKS
jgi:hypothetical protein